VRFAFALLMTPDAALSRAADARDRPARSRALQTMIRNRLRLACFALAWAVLILVPLTLLLFDQAASHRAATAARAAVDAIDFDVAVTEALLTGLAPASALDARAPASFRAQTVEVATSAGSWIVLFGPNGWGRISTLRSFDPSGHEGSAARREVVAGGRPCVLLLRASGAEGQTIGIGVTRKGKVTSVLAPMPTVSSSTRVLDPPHLPAGWRSIVRDPGGATILARDTHTPAGASVGEGCVAEAASLLADAGSARSGWAVLAVVPDRDLGAPLYWALAAGAGAGGVLLIGAIALLFLLDARTERMLGRSIEASEGRFRVMADTVPSILFTTDPDGRCDYVNQRFCEYTGMTTEAARGFGWIAAVHPDDQPRVQRNLTRPSGGDLRLNEIRLRARDGTYRWFLDRKRAMRDTGGSVVKWFGSSTDIDDLKRSDAAVQRTNQRLIAVLSSIDECYYTVDRQWRITDVNTRAADFFCQDAASLLGCPLWEVGLGLFDGGIKAQFERALREHVAVHLEHQTVRDPRSWLAIHCYPWADGLSVFFSDVTPRKSAELAVQRTQELLHRTMDALSAEILILDEYGVLIAANAAWQRSNVLQAGCNYVAACRAAIPDELQREAAVTGLAAMLRGERRDTVIYYGRPTNGVPRWFQMRATCFGEGDALRVAIAHEDITEITRAEMELRQLTGRLLRVQDEERRRMAHELHETTAQNLVVTLMDFDRLAEVLSGIDKTSKALLDESRALVERSLQEIRTLSYLLHPPLLDELGLASALRWFVRGFQSRSGIAVSLTVSPDLGRLPEPVESALFRVVQESLTNIHRHSGSATAEINLANLGDEVSLRITDQGRGLPVERSGKTSDPALLGVGISGMRARLQQLGGELSIHSTSKGATVMARLSIRPSPVAGELAPRSASE
jgi:two-component system, NarL family, sensor kinase